MSLMLAGTAQILPLLMYIPVICIFSYIQKRMSYNFLKLTTPIIIEKNMETTCYSRFEMKIIWINCKNGNRTFSQLYRGLVSLTLSSPKSVSVDFYSNWSTFPLCVLPEYNLCPLRIISRGGRNNFDREWME